MTVAGPHRLPQHNPRTPLEDLEFTLLGSVVGPADPHWDKARAAWNLTADQQPAAVVFTVDAADVSATVRYATALGLNVLAQSTGHLATAVGDLAGTVLIRTARMRSVRVDAEKQTMRVEAGATWGVATAALEGTGLAALAGSSGEVGIVGYTLGGGYSWLSRSRGLAASSVTAIELVLADGNLLRATAEEHAELFWAVRGGGGNFGIVTALEFRVYPVSEVSAGMLLFPLEQTRSVLEEYARWTEDLDERATTCFRILHFPRLPDLPDFLRGQSFVGVDGAIDAPEDVAQRLLAPLRALEPSIDTFTRIPATALAGLHLDPSDPVPVIGDGMILDSLTPEVVDALLGSAAGMDPSALLIVDLRHLGGALGRPAGGGAVDHLPGRFLLYAAGIAPSPQAAAAVITAITSVRLALAPWASSIDYSNFREVREAPERFWAPDVLERLRAVKKSVDPRGIIRSAHTLEPRTSTSSRALSADAAPDDLAHRIPAER
ncbi:FAD/FMN-containing dehydrogenase [Rathayibacter oskolensis]|uniref:FAD/FMN-containing dehydrogenase n=1 Tax=Rathayibacter oskolensis TaxID=1891671 RepID=A0A1X7NZI4_9MICO|nr:FAD-binding oxidoreductase [Rathayibacter oskolensis]SMH42817.1 FAD/FMN-containing dehydrogenase [Rathayibacter oskolensis]